MQTLSRLIYGPSLEDRVKEWRQRLRQEGRHLARESRQLEAAITRTKAEARTLARKGDTRNARILAREIVRCNAQVNRLAVSQARLNSIGMQLGHQLATAKTLKTVTKSSEIMKLSSSLVKMPQLSATMRDFSAEMTKAGILDEMVSDTFDALDDDAVEEDADAEVDRVLGEITGQKLSDAPAAAHTEPPLAEAPAEPVDLDKMEARIDGLLNG